MRHLPVALAAACPPLGNLRRQIAVDFPVFGLADMALPLLEGSATRLWVRTRMERRFQQCGRSGFW